MQQEDRRVKWSALVAAGRWWLLAAIAVAVSVFASWQSAAWATPPQDPLRQTVPTPAAGQTVTTVTPTTEAAATSAAGDVELTIPAGAVTEDVNVVISALTLTQVAAPPTGLRLLGHAVQIQVFKGITLQPGFTFAKPVILCITYTSADLSAVGGDPANFTLIQYKDDGTTVTHTPTVDSADSKVCFEVTSLSTFVLGTDVPAALPSVGDASPPTALLGLALVGALLLGGGLLVRRWTR